MKTLQNNFTTPDQSKRLLELGVPADSSDIVYYHTPDSQYDPFIIKEELDRRNIRVGRGFPCWSVGRLMKILKICVIDKEALAEIFEELRDCVDETKSLIKILDEYSDVLDFSKLEE